MAGGGGHVLKSFLALGHSEATLFDGSALSSETENKQALRDGDDFQKIAAMRQLLAVGMRQCIYHKKFGFIADVLGAAAPGPTPSRSRESYGKFQRGTQATMLPLCYSLMPEGSSPFS